MRETMFASVIPDVVQSETSSRDVKISSTPFLCTQGETPDTTLPCFVIFSQFTW